MDSIVFIIFLITGLIAGGIAGWYFAKSKFNIPVPFAAEDFVTLSNEKMLLEQKLADLRTVSEELKRENFSARERSTSQTIEISRLDTVNKSLNEKLLSQKAELEELHKKIKEQFENIASKIIFDNSRMIQQQHSDKLSDLLNPLKEKIEKFENTVNVTHKESIRENQSMKEQLKLLQDMNKSIGEEARNLTSALKGQVKTQGNWGEVILETILERSGLVKDREYHLQTSMTSDEGRRLQPDVIINLPENKTIIVDSKVSLVAYEKFANAATQEERDAAIKEHLISMRRHIKGLGEKKYQQLYDIKTLDFVLLFVPVEPAFTAAIQHDPGLFNEAFDNNIVIVSTSTLLATLRTIAHLWKLEYQNKNALEIARQGGALYDKFVGLVADLTKLGEQIDQTHRSWESAVNKLSSGRGNLVVSVQKLKNLGANAAKSLPSGLLDDATEADESEDANNVPKLP